MPEATPLTPAIIDRFWAKVDVRPDACWEWQGATSGTDGYGRFWIASRLGVLPYRFAYELLVGPIPDGLQPDHVCRNRACVRPDHLEVVTSRENTLRGFGVTAVNAQKTHCAHGHPFEGHNLIIRSCPDGSRRVCRTCANRAAAKRQRRRAERRGAA